MPVETPDLPEKTSFLRTTPPGHPTAGTKSSRWSRDWRDIAAFVLAFCILCLWISASAFVIHKHLFLPLNYWHKRYGGVLDDGNYNTLVAVAGGVAASIVCFGIGQAIKQILRKELTSDRGLTVRKYSTLVKLANQGIDLRWRLSSLLPLALFILINLFGAATQAAFGTSIAALNITIHVPRPRLRDNIGEGLDWMDIRPPDQTMIHTDWELQLALSGVVNSFEDGHNNSLIISLDRVDFTYVEGAPLQAVLIDYHLLSLSADEVDVRAYASGSEVEYLEANYGSTKAYAQVEGFSTHVTCGVTHLSSSYTKPVTEDLIEYTLRFPDCNDTRVKSYDRKTELLLDSYACLDKRSTNVYFVRLDPTNASVTAAWVCTVGDIRSTIGWNVVQALGKLESRPIGVSTDQVVLDITAELVAWSGHELWNNFYQEGSFELRDNFIFADAIGLHFAKVLERTTALITSACAAKLANVIGVLAARTNPRSDWFTYIDANQTSFYEVQALKLHLSGRQLAWIGIPACLLWAIAWLSATYFLRGSGPSGRVDFTDPCAVMLMAEAEREQSAWQGRAESDSPDKIDQRRLWMKSGL